MDTTAPLFGKFHSPLGKARQPLRQQPLHHLQNLCHARIAPASLAPNASGDNSRERTYTPALTFYAFLDQILNADSSCRRAVRQIQSFYQSLPQSAPPRISTNNSAYCQARARWSTAERIEIRRQLAQGPQLHADTLLEGLACSRPLTVIDGTCLSLPETPKNQALYPPGPHQKPGCGFPLLRVMAVFCLKTGALLEEATGPYTTSETALLHQLWPTLQPGDIAVADRNFSSYATLAAWKLQGVDSLFHLHGSRKVDFREGIRLGPQDHLFTWQKPRRPSKVMPPVQWDQRPDAFTVRVIRFRVRAKNRRVKTITLVTTLLEPKLWPAQLLAQLYARRWGVELYFDDLKTTLQMEMLSCQSPDMCQKEFQMHLIAYNLIRGLMAEAALTCHAPLARMSFKGTIDAALQYSIRIETIPPSYRHRRRKLYLEMLSAIASDPVPERPGRREPRCQKRRPKAYPFLNKPRHLMKDAKKGFRYAAQKRRALS